jgi:ribose transport system substrate-binding protein
MIGQHRDCPTIAVFTKNLKNPAYASARLGADRAAKRLGATTRHYVPRKPDDAQEQIALIHAALEDAPEAMAVVPVHPTALNAALREVAAAGVPLFAFINRFSDPAPITFVGADDYALGVEIATHLYRHLGGQGKVVVLEGVPRSETSRERVRGFTHALERFPDVRIVATACGEYLREPARRAAVALLDSGLAFDAVLAANDEMALGALEALEARGRQSVIVGINAIPEAITAIREGKLLATADFNAMKVSALAIEAAIRHSRGEFVPGEILLPAKIVDATNFRAWDLPFEERELASWESAVG